MKQQSPRSVEQFPDSCPAISVQAGRGFVINGGGVRSLWGIPLAIGGVTPSPASNNNVESGVGAQTARVDYGGSAPVKASLIAKSGGRRRFDSGLSTENRGGGEESLHLIAGQSSDEMIAVSSPDAATYLTITKDGKITLSNGGVK